MIKQALRPTNIHKAYHAHVYFDESTVDAARKVYDQIQAKFITMPIGSFIESLVGPHPMWSFQVTFSHKDFDLFIPWLDKNRRSLTVFVHGLTGDDVKDHTDYAYWLGDAVALNLNFFNINE